MKSIIQWLNTFESPYREQALEFASKDPEYNYHDYFVVQFDNPISALTSAFQFTDCMGFQYWENFIDEHLR